MLLTPNKSRMGFRVSNLPATPAVSMGATVTTGAANTLGSWVEVLTAAQLTQPLAALYLNANTLSTAGALNRSAGMEVGIDPAGGTSYTTIISGISVGALATNLIGLGGGRQFYFPIYIPAGASVAVRAQSAQATQTLRVLAYGFGQPSNPEVVFTGQYSETIGWQSAGSQGVSITSGNGAWGSYVSLGTSVSELNWLQYGIGCNDSSMSAIYLHVEVAIGDVTNKETIAQISLAHSTAEFQQDSLHVNGIPAFCEIPIKAGTEFFARAWASTTPDTFVNIAVVGIG